MNDNEKIEVFSKDEIERLNQFEKKDFPALYENIELNNIIIFLGAGISKLYGIPLWNELALKLSEKVFEQKIINYSQFKILEEESKINPKKCISIVKNIFEEINKEYEYFSILKNIIMVDEKNEILIKKFNEIYDILFKLEPRCIITTNIDNVLNLYTKFKKNNDETFRNIKEFDLTSKDTCDYIKNKKFDCFKDYNIFYLHGNYNNIENAVFTVSHYIKYYQDKTGFLNNFFEEFRRIDPYLIFLGYGLSELDVLEKICRTGKIKEGNNIIDRGINLVPIFTREVERISFDRLYFKSFGLKTIPYIIDEKGYERIIDVIKTLSEVINNNKLKIMDFYEKVKNGEKEKIIKIAKTSSIYEFSLFRFKEVDISWFDSLLKGDFFSPSKAPPPKTSDDRRYFYFPHWPALDYLERVSEELRNLEEKDRGKYIELLLKIISDTTKYHTKNNKKLDNFRIWTCFIKILSNIPNEKIEKDELEFFVKNWLDSNFSVEMQFIEIGERLLPKFLKSNDNEDIEKAEIIISYLTQIKWYSKYSEKQRKEFEENKELAGLFELEKESPKLLASEYWFYKIFNENKEIIAEKVSDDTVLIFADRLIEIFQKKYKGKFDYSRIWLRTIKDETNPDEVEIAIVLVLRDILKVRINKTSIVEKLISDTYFDYSIFKRLIIFLIAEDFEKLKGIFKILLEKEGSLYFNNITYEPELYYLLQKNVDRISDFSEVIIDILENKVPDAREKLKWYSPLKSNKIFSQYYDKYFKIVGEEPKPYFTISSTIISGPGPSPLRKEEILNMDDKKLVDYIKNFKPESNGSFDEKPTARGFSEMIRVSVKEKPEKFIRNLKEYTKIPFFYFADVLWGIYDALSDNKVGIKDVKNFISGIVEYLKADDFWNDTYYLKPDNFDIYHIDHLSIISIIFIVFDKITYHESVKKDIEIISIIWDITIEVINKIIEKKEMKEYDDKDDLYLTNSTLANIIRVLINLLYLQKINNKLDEIIKIFDNSYQKLLNNECKEAIFWFGTNFDFLYSTNKEWSNEVVEFIRKDNKKWEVFMSGYCWNNRFDYDSYLFLKEDYKKALEYNFEKEDNEIKSVLIQNICYSYLIKNEELDSDGLFSKLLNEWNYKYIEEMINFFWRTKEDEENKEKDERIINFWSWIYKNKYENKDKILLNENDKKILSELSKLTILLDEINKKNSEWLKISACFIEDINSSFFIEYLNRIKDKGESYKYLGEIFKEILNSTTPFYKKEDIRSIIEFLYQKSKDLKDKVLANQIIQEVDDIIDIYNKRGYEFLNDLYEKYHKSK